MNALWLILYDLQPDQEEEYLTWFHEVHIPEKLARPGYSWAAHYRADASGTEGRNRYAALFGGEESSVFYNPSPEQIKPKQPPDTRAMMGIRAASSMFILAREWTRGKQGILPGEECAVKAECLTIKAFETEAANQSLPARLVQEDWPKLVGQTDFKAMHKYLASTGAPRHLSLVESDQEITADKQVLFSGKRLWP